MRTLVHIIVAMMVCEFAFSNALGMDATRGHEEVKNIIIRQDWSALSNVVPSDFEKFTSEERNEIAVLLAKNLKSNEPGVARKLRGMIERQFITDSKVIPYLIESLGTPKSSFPNEASWHFYHSDIFESLFNLTGHVTGWETYRNREIPEEEIDWWKKWWELNKDKHPIIDAELRKKALDRTTQLMRIIDKEVKPLHWELSYFSIPNPVLVPYEGNCYELEYNPRMLARVMLPRTGPPILSKGSKPAFAQTRDGLPWMLVRYGFATPEGPGTEKHRPPYYDHQSPKELLPLVKTVYSEIIPGTDVEVKVLLASPNKELVRDMESILKKTVPRTISPPGS